MHAYKKDRYRCKWRDKATLVQKQSCTKALVPPDRPTETPGTVQAEGAANMLKHSYLVITLIIYK